MRTVVARVASLLLLLFAVPFITACGGGSDSPTAPVSPYGFLNFSGTGTASVGSEFRPRDRAAISNFGITTVQWYSFAIPEGVTYPHVGMVVAHDSNGAISFVDVYKLVSENSAVAHWLIYFPSTGQVSLTGTAIAFNNLVLPGQGTEGAGTSLTVNGTVNY